MNPAETSLLITKPIYWTDWNAVAPDITGTITTASAKVQVIASGVYDFVHYQNETNYWNPSTPYLSRWVPNAPSGDIIALNEGGTETIEFSTEVRDPLIGLISWNGNTVDFGVPIEFLSYGPGYYGDGTPVINETGTGFYGDGEVHGVIRLPGVYKTVTFTHTTENWHGFTVGIVAAPSKSGTMGNDSLKGNNGDDWISGQDGNDTLDGGLGNDSLDGGAGNDSLIGGAGIDTLSGQTGNDTYLVDTVSDVVIELNDQGIDTIRSAITYTTSANVENIILTGTQAINATGNDLANMLTGNTGANVLDGRGGNDTMIGGKGNDTYIIDSDGDVITELSNQGTDLILSSVSYTASANVENLTLTSTAEQAMGNSLNNVLTGNSAANYLNGGLGADTLIGGAGHDTYAVDNAKDVVKELRGEGHDTVFATTSYTLGANIEDLFLEIGIGALKGTGNDLSNGLFDTSGNSTQLDGAAGNDTLMGNAGDDTLIGGIGADLLTGGIGSDLFVFMAGSTALTIGGSGNAGTLAGHDRISDFALGFVTGAQDKIDTIGTPVVVANTSGVNGIDSKLTIAGQAIKSHAIKDGMITFDDADTYAAPLSLGSLSDVAAVVQYLQGNNLGKAGASVAFDADTGGVHHTFLFTQGDAKGTNNALDVLVDLVGVDAGRLAAATAGMTASTLLIG